MVKQHAEGGMDMPVLCIDCKASYVTNFASFARDVKMGRRSTDWLEYFMLL